MTYKRLIGCIVVRGGLAVQSFAFNRYLPIGKPEVVAEYLNRWEVDEIFLLDIEATHLRRAPDYQMVERVAKHIFTPLTVGGGVHKRDHIHNLLRSGADKVAINSAIFDNPDLLTRAAERYGCQCLVASVDAQKTNDGYRAYLRDQASGQHQMPLNDLIARAERYGAGEILLNSVDRDGRRCGYDLDLLKTVEERVSVPLIALGGAGHPDHIADAMRLSCVSAVAVGNMLNHCEHSVATIKDHLSDAGIKMRHGSHSDWFSGPFGEDGRLSKKSESRLDDVGFIKTESDAI